MNLTRSITRRLCEHLLDEGYAVWTEVPLERIANHMRADVLALKVGFFWEHTDLRIYEVKTTRPDFKGDIKRGKTLRYLPYAHRVFYAGPPDIVAAHEVDERIGIVHVRPDSITSVRPAPFLCAPENTGLLLYLLARPGGCKLPQSDQEEVRVLQAP